MSSLASEDGDGGPGAANLANLNSNSEATAAKLLGYPHLWSHSLLIYPCVSSYLAVGQ